MLCSRRLYPPITSTFATCVETFNNATNFHLPVRHHLSAPGSPFLSLLLYNMRHHLPKTFGHHLLQFSRSKTQQRSHPAQHASAHVNIVTRACHRLNITNARRDLRCHTLLNTKLADGANQLNNFLVLRIVYGLALPFDYRQPSAYDHTFHLPMTLFNSNFA